MTNQAINIQAVNQHWTERNIKDYLYRVVADFLTQLEDKMETLPITQAELAEKLGVSEGRVSQIFNSSSNLELKSIIKYARALGLKVAVVAYDDNDPGNNRGLINSEIFNICWERQGKPVDFFELEEKLKQSLDDLPTSTTNKNAGVLVAENTDSFVKQKVVSINDWKSKSNIGKQLVTGEDLSTTNTTYKRIA